MAVTYSSAPDYTTCQALASLVNFFSVPSKLINWKFITGALHDDGSVTAEFSTFLANGREVRLNVQNNDRGFKACIGSI